MLEGFRKKLAYVYATRNGRVAMVVGALVFVPGLVFPFIFPTFLIVLLPVFLTVMIILSLVRLPRKDFSPAQQEVLEYIPDPQESNQIGVGFLPWMFIPALMALPAAAIIITGDLRAFIVVDSPGPFFDYLHGFCEASGAQRITERITDGACDTPGFSPVLTAHFLAVGWISAGSVVYLYLNRGIFLSGCRFNRYPILGNVVLTLGLLGIDILMCFMVVRVIPGMFPVAAFGTFMESSLHASLYDYGTYIEAFFYQMLYGSGLYIVYMMSLITYYYLVYGVIVRFRSKRRG